MGKGKSTRIQPRIPRGFRDIFATELDIRREMIDTLRQVYELHGFDPLDTGGVEFVDVLGKFLPDVDRPEGGIFAFRDDDDQWIALRYDLTAPLSRVVAQYRTDLPLPFRRYQIGSVFRQEKPGPGRFREFMQCDFDTVGSKSPAADAEVCSVLSTALEALGIDVGDYMIHVNNRKVLNGVLDAIGLPEGDFTGDETKRPAVLRAIDKLDRLGIEGVRLLLGEGRKDPSGDFTAGAGLSNDQIDRVIAFVEAGSSGLSDRAKVLSNLRDIVGSSKVGLEGVEELTIIAELMESMGLGANKAVINPGIVRGLAYYTGSVFEAELTFEILDKKGRPKPFGSVAGGGRYDDLVGRFTGQQVPATGASIGLDRLMSALIEKGRITSEQRMGPVVVTIMDKSQLPQYQKMTAELRTSGIAAELFLGGGNFGKQVKYADKRNSPIAVIAGEDEFAKGQITLKDLYLGRELAKDIADRGEWTSEQPAQVTVPREKLITAVREILARYDG